MRRAIAAQAIASRRSSGPAPFGGAAAHMAAGKPAAMSNRRRSARPGSQGLPLTFLAHGSNSDTARAAPIESRQVSSFMAIRPRRSALYMPGSNARAIEKARTLPADAVILDLEDSVAPDAKQAARDSVIRAVKAGGFG